MRNQRLAPMNCSSPKSRDMQEEPHLSGAYIRRLVNHLSSSSTTRSKDHNHITMGTKPHSQPQQQASSQTTPPSKKQVRRRLHTSRPYQERLLNMAEARREIVTALKIHRASMRQDKEQQKQQQLQHQQDVQLVQDQIKQQAAWSAPMSAYGLSFSDFLHNSSPPAEFTATGSSCSYYSSPILPYHTPLVAPPVVPIVDAFDHLLPLQDQQLGLNLSFHGFNGVVAGEGDKNTPDESFDPPPFLQPSHASSYSVYSSPPPAMTMACHDVSSSAITAADNASLHWVLDDEEMAAVCSTGERHDIEWSDTVNLVTSAWWSKLLDSVEGDNGSPVAQQAVGAVGMHLSDEYYGEDGSLPRMDIGEIEGWDTDWFVNFDF